MRHIRTKLGTRVSTDAPKTVAGKVLDLLNPNPDYDHSLVHEWFIEFGDDDLPGREIGLDSDGTPVLAGPDERNYGFWLDTGMRFDDFDGVVILREQFVEKWNMWSAQED